MRLCFETVMRKRNRSIDLEKENRHDIHDMERIGSSIRELAVQKGGSSLMQPPSSIY